MLGQHLGRVALVDGAVLAHEELGEIPLDRLRAKKARRFLLSSPGKVKKLLLYGGDSGQTNQYRQGTVYFYNNSMVVTGNGASAYPDALLFFLMQPSARAEVWNNIFYAAPATPGHQPKAMAMAYAGAGTVNLANNWMSATVAAAWLGHASPAKVTGWGANIIANGSPGFQNQGPFPYAPAAGSALINAGKSLASLKPGTAPLWLPQAQSLGLPVARTQDGQIDIGAFEY